MAGQLAATGIRVEGLAELKRALRKADDEFKREFKQEQKAASAKVAVLTRGDWPRRTGQMAGKVKALQASTKLADDAAGWLEFGGKRPQDTEGRPYLPEGRAMFPAARRVGPEFEAACEEMLDRVNDRNDLT